MKKLKGFTIMELIVVLVVSGILITICLRVYTNFSRYINKTLIEQDIENKVVWFALRLKEDIFKADYITGNSETLNIYNFDQKISYEFFSNKVLIQRHDDQTADTVKLEIKDVSVDYIKPGIINYIEFEYNNEGNTYTFSSSKKYSLRFLFDNL